MGENSNLFCTASCQRPRTYKAKRESSVCLVTTTFKTPTVTWGHTQAWKHSQAWIGRCSDTMVHHPQCRDGTSRGDPVRPFFCDACHEKLRLELLSEAQSPTLCLLDSLLARSGHERFCFSSAHYFGRSRVSFEGGQSGKLLAWLRPS
jgi:hypothetical protein